MITFLHIKFETIYESPFSYLFGIATSPPRVNSDVFLVVRSNGMYNNVKLYLYRYYMYNVHNINAILL